MEAGATVAIPLSEVYWGEMFCKIVDPFGHVWSLSKRVEILTPEEIAIRASGGLAAVVTEPMADDIAVPSDDIDVAVA